MCGGLGRCEGEGTRLGDGECICDPGYSGQLCQNCADGYYREKSSNDSAGACAGASHPDTSVCIKPVYRYIQPTINMYVYLLHEGFWSLQPVIAHVGNARAQRTTSASPANPAGSFMTTSVWVSVTIGVISFRLCQILWEYILFDWVCISRRHWWMWHRAGSLSFQHLLSQHRRILWMQRYVEVSHKWARTNQEAGTIVFLIRFIS